VRGGIELSTKSAGNAPLEEEARQLLHVGGAGLGHGGEPLEPPDLDPVGAAEVVEGVVGGDQDPPLRGNPLDLVPDPGVQRLEFGVQLGSHAR
jgi:hypothetical protein